MDNNLIDFIVSLEDTKEETHGVFSGPIACGIEPGQKKCCQ